MNDLLHGLIAFFEREPLVVGLDVLDITVVASLIYFGLSLIKGTRGMQMSIGLALIFVLHQLARRFGLITMWTLLDALLTYSVLVIVIIFQNDVRRALMKVGQRPLWGRKTAGRETHVIEEVIKAAGSLAQRRIGALIVFERDASLDEFIETGTEIDAAVSKELLYGIFIPSFENPMHDGAVIIREGRVWQAGAFLPLSVSSKLDRTLGARHRAAIGITEETDAVVVVVSEERGAITLCFGGNLVRNLDGPSLREALHGLFYKRARGRDDKVDEARKRTESARPSAPPDPADGEVVDDGRDDEAEAAPPAPIPLRAVREREDTPTPTPPAPTPIATKAVKKAEEKSG